MTSDFEIMGEWHCPNCEEWVKGTLTYNSELGAELILHGTFNQFILDRSSKEIVLGNTTEGEVTLIDVWYKSSSTYNPTNITISKYQPIMILIGHHFTSESDICFDKVRFKMFNLFNWFSLTGKSFDFGQKENGYSIMYDKVPQKDFLIDSISYGNFSFDSHLNFDSKINRSEIKEEVYVNLFFQKEINFRIIIDYIFKFVRLFTLFINEQTYPLSILFESSKLKEEVGKKTRPKTIQCIYKNSFYSKNHKIRMKYEHLVKYENVQDSLSEIIKKWFELYHEVEDVFILITNHFKDKYYFTSIKFMDCVRALESYHRSFYCNERIPEKQYEILVNSILTQVEIDKPDNEWLKAKLMGNEPSLRKRIKDILKNNQNQYTKLAINDVRKFCQDVTLSRNYYTHYDKKSKDKALDGKELSDITRQLRGLLLSAILTDLNLKNENFEEGLIQHLI